MHFFFVYGAVFWTCWLITEFYKEYISLRQAYVIRNTEAANAHIGGSAEAFEQEKQPIITSRGSERRSSFRSSINPLADLDGSGKHPVATPDAAWPPRRSSLDFINEVRDASLMNHLNTPLRILHAEGAPRKDSIGVLTNRSVSFSGRSVYETPYNARPGYGDGAGSGSNSNSPSKSPATSISGYSGLYAQEGCSDREGDDRDGEFDVDDHLDTETDNESVVEEAVSVQVLNQGSRALVDIPALRLMLRRQVAVGIPASVEDLDVTDAPLHQPPDLQAAGYKGARRVDVVAIEAERVGSFA